MRKAEAEDFMAEMLEQLSELSGVPLEDVMASEFEEPETDDFKTSDVYEEETSSEDLDMEADFSGDMDDYLDGYLEDHEVADEQDAYGDEAL